METDNVHLLVVEDNPRFLDELLEWLIDFNYQNIETATSAAQAQEKLAHPFDVIIADMRMEQDDIRIFYPGRLYIAIARHSRNL
ncbi:MAG: response regulator [Phormidium sp. GEM2.Bin31]|nr:MAG: response regulator [Phormidium sp. GEM2.Bin31]